MLRATIILAVALAGSTARAEDADHYRGGWRAEGGEPQVYEFVIDGTKVTGIACTRCADGTTLARVEGTFDEANGIAFTIRHLKPDGSLASQDRARARLVSGKLMVTGTRQGGVAFQQTTIKDPRGPTPGAFLKSGCHRAPRPSQSFNPRAAAEGAAGPHPIYNRHPGGN